MNPASNGRRRMLFPDDRESLPPDGVIDGAALEADVEDAADFVVIGSGAAGATTAVTLASAGFEVIILEEGPWVRTREFGVDLYPALKRMYRDVGSQVSMGRAPIVLLQGRCVGGSTTVNSAIAWRAPDHVIDGWGRDYGLADVLSNRSLEPHYDAIERSLNVHSVDDRALGRQDRLLGEAARSVGIRAERLRRYDGGCDASASCATGCRTGKKLGMNVSYVPQSLHRGARIYTQARADRIESRFGRATAVRATVLGPRRRRLRLVARRGVLVAASAVQTPAILRRSGVRLPSLGRHFQTHPGTTLTARFDGRVAMDIGATQGYNSTHFVESDGYKIESLSLPPEILCCRIPEIGPRLMDQIMHYGQLLNWAVIVRGESQGTVGGLLGADQVWYSPTRRDVARIRTALRKVSELMFAVGAREIFPCVHGMPHLKSPDDLVLWDRASLDPRAYAPLMSSHLFGSARMGRDPADTVTGTDFQVHGVRGIYVVDSSVFPTTLGVNPQHTIMAVARLAATRIADCPLPPRQ